MADDVFDSGDLSGVNDSTTPVESSETVRTEQPAADTKPVEQHVPYTRFKEVNDGYRQTREEANQLKAELAILNRQIQALTGVKPEPVVDPQEQAVRKQLEQWYPHLGKQPESLTLEQARALVREEQQKAQYSTLADSTMAQVYEAGKSLYGKDLTERQKLVMRNDFIEWVSEDPARADRYVARDARLIAEWKTDFASTTLDPVRRQAAVTLDKRLARTATVPTGGSGSAVATQVQKPAGLDAVIDARADELFAAR